MSFIDDIQNLDPDNIGAWPLAIKASGIALASILIAFLWYYLIIKDKIEEIEVLERKEMSLKQTFIAKQNRVVNLDALKQQLRDMEESFGGMLRQLPNKTEVAGLLEDISQTGLASGLEFELFQPEGERTKVDYAELPIKIRVVGTYHQFGDFVSGIAALPRIVTVNDMSIRRRDKNTARNKGQGEENIILTMEATATTYRYLDEEEEKE